MSAINIIETKWRWNGSLSQRSRTDYIALHHAEASTCTAAQVDEWHKSNGWSGIGYHFFVRKDGSIYRGRPLTTMGAHVSGMNDRSIGICAEGKYSTETMPDVQKRAICRLLVYLKDNYYPSAKIVGHREIGDSDCPGRNYPLEDIKQNYRAYGADEEGLTVTQYEELKAEIKEVKDDIERILTAIGGTFVYNYNDKNVPEWAREALTAAINCGAIQGNENGELDLNIKDLRDIVKEYRRGMYN